MTRHSYALRSHIKKRVLTDVDEDTAAPQNSMKNLTKDLLEAVTSHLDAHALRSAAMASKSLQAACLHSTKALELFTRGNEGDLNRRKVQGFQELVRKCPNIETLRMSLDRRDVIDLPVEMRSLTHLYLTGGSISGLRKAPSLEVLEVCSPLVCSPLIDKGNADWLHALVETSPLRKLYVECFDNCPVNFANARCDMLEELKIGRGDARLPPVMQKLRVLDLWGTVPRLQNTGNASLDDSEALWHGGFSTDV